MAVIKKIENISKSEWQQLLAYSSTASYFQSPAFYEFFKSLSFLETFGWGIYRNDELNALVCGYLIKNGGSLTSFFSRRAVIHGGLLLADDVSNEEVELLLKELVRNLSKKAIYIEIRNYQDYSAYKPYYEKTGFSYQEHLNFHVRTPDKEIVFSQLNTTKRRDVRISIKNGAELISAPNMEQVGEYYGLLSELYASKIKLPLFPLEFFEKLRQTAFGRFFLISFQGKIIGGSVCVELKHEVLYEMFVCGLDREYKNIYASTLATWFAIEYAASNNIKHFDMMGAGKPNDGYGVREFKSKFGGELVEYGRFVYICNSFLYSIGKLGVNLLKRK